MIIVLGSNGFVGSAICEYLESHGEKFAGVDLDNYESLKGTSCEYLVNAGGNSSKRLADEDPLKDFEMNVSAVLRALTDFPAKTYLHISSIDVYNDQSNPDRNTEDSPIETALLSRYGYSKWLGEQVCQRYAPSWVIFRLGGMLGHNSRKGPAHDILNGFPIWQSPQSRFLFLNTATVAEGIWRLRDQRSEVFNLTAADNLSLEEFALLTGKPIADVKGTDAPIYRVSIQKAARLFPLPTSHESVSRFIKDLKK